MLGFLSSIAEEVVAYVEWTTFASSTIFQMVSSAGKFLLESAVLLLTTVWICAVHLLDGATILFREFILFLADISDLCDALLKHISRTIDQLVQGIWSSTICLYNMIQQIHYLFYAVFDNALHLLVSALLSLKALLILVGNSTLLVLELGPYTVFSLLSTTVSIGQRAIQGLWHLFFHITNNIVSALYNLHQEVLDIPPSSLLGLFLALVLSLLLRYYIKSIDWVDFWQRARTSVGGWLHRRRGSLPAVPSTFAFKKLILASRPTSEANGYSKNHLLRQLEKEREDKLCVVCQDRFKCIILLPCRHFCLCQICTEMLAETDPSCPLCRRFVRDSLKVYG